MTLTITYCLEKTLNLLQIASTKLNCARVLRGWWVLFCSAFQNASSIWCTPPTNQTKFLQSWIH